MSITVKDVFKGYSTPATMIPILKGVNFVIQEGERVAIVGPSGSGKSTLLALLGGIDKADSGSVEMFGANLSNLSESALTSFRSQKIGIVFQQFHLMGHLTALENVMLPLEIRAHQDQSLNLSLIEQKAKQALKDLGLEDRVTHFPGQLSGGECQRVAIARAIVTRPELILADEPTGNLDSATGEMVMEVFFNVVRNHKLTTILVTHSEQLAKRCDRVLRMDSGKLVEQ